MSQATLCDRCGLVVRGAIPTDQPTIGGEKLDLCATCSESLGHWRDGKATEGAMIDAHFRVLAGER